MADSSANPTSGMNANYLDLVQAAAALSTFVTQANALVPPTQNAAAPKVSPEAVSLVGSVTAATPPTAPTTGSSSEKTKNSSREGATTNRDDNQQQQQQQTISAALFLSYSKLLDNKDTFPRRLMKVLGDESLSEIITWLPNGTSFAVLNPADFASKVMPKYFASGRGLAGGSTKYQSFTRKLNRWYVLICVAAALELSRGCLILPFLTLQCFLFSVWIQGFPSACKGSRSGSFFSRRLSTRSSSPL